MCFIYLKNKNITQVEPPAFLDPHWGGSQVDEHVVLAWVKRTESDTEDPPTTALISQRVSTGFSHWPGCHGPQVPQQRDPAGLSSYCHYNF